MGNFLAPEQNLPPWHADKFYNLILTSSTQQTFYKALKYQLDVCESKYDSSIATPICSCRLRGTVRLKLYFCRQVLMLFRHCKLSLSLKKCDRYSSFCGTVLGSVYAVHMHFILFVGSESPKASEIFKVSEGWQRMGESWQRRRVCAMVELGVFSMPSPWNSGTNCSSF